MCPNVGTLGFRFAVRVRHATYMTNLQNTFCDVDDTRYDEPFYDCIFCCKLSL